MDTEGSVGRRLTEVGQEEGLALGRKWRENRNMGGGLSKASFIFS